MDIVVISDIVDIGIVIVVIVIIVIDGYPVVLSNIGDLSVMVSIIRSLVGGIDVVNIGEPHRDIDRPQQPQRPQLTSAASMTSLARYHFLSADLRLPHRQASGGLGGLD
jgi:hypothetical protein